MDDLRWTMEITDDDGHGIHVYSGGQSVRLAY